MFMESVKTLSELATKLQAIQDATEVAVKQTLQEANSSVSFGVDLTTSFREQYSRIEEEFVKTYSGEIIHPNDVWESIEAGECFPSFPYVWLPAGDTGWWDVGNPTIRKWWVKEALQQAGWQQDEDGEWYKQLSSSDSIVDDVVDDDDDEDDSLMFGTSLLQKLRSTRLDFDQNEAE